MTKFEHTSNKWIKQKLKVKLNLESVPGEDKPSSLWSHWRVLVSLWVKCVCYFEHNVLLL